MGPIVAGLAEEYAGKNIKIGKCNVDENQNIAGQYNIMSIPTIAIFKGGKMVDQMTGGVQKERLKEMIDKVV
jgi:thioredoxin 1